MSGKKEILVNFTTPEQAEETKHILSLFDREEDGSKVRSKHFRKIIEYMVGQKTELYEKTVSKLTISLGVGDRIIKENYLKGLEAWGIIRVDYIEGRKTWFWMGTGRET